VADKDSSIVSATKATLLGGAIFLIPGFLAVFVLGKVFGALKSLALALGPKLGIATWLGGALLDVVAIAAVVLVCFFAGLLARRAAAQRMRARLDQLLLGSFPGYAFVKGMAENMQHTQEIAGTFLPVLVSFDDNRQLAFETGRLPGGTVSVYVPGAPNPWSGGVFFMNADRVRKLPITIPEALKVIRALGRGSDALAAEILALESGQPR
jgi:uncharacterized membrane protein